MTVPVTRPSNCTTCAYLDEFHSTCTHPFRQTLFRSMTDSAGECPVSRSRRD